ncbi:MAG: ERCC4 domain-containing protein [Candidatus Micrarchaeota archaeon]
MVIQKASIVVDQREEKAFDDRLTELGAQVERKQLEIGDFICSHRTIVERKTREDFESSIIDGRLFSQLQNMISAYPRVIIIVEGENSADIISKEALLGAYATIITDFGAAIFFTRDKQKTSELIYAIAKHEQLADKHILRIFPKKKTHTVSQSQRAIIETFPMIGPKMAKILLEHFGNVENIINAKEEKLLEVNGMGEKRAKTIRSVIEGEYKKEEDE